MAAINFNPVTFRGLFPAFQCVPPISDDVLNMYWATANLYISNPTCYVYTPAMNTAQYTQALYLMTAHLLAISRLIAQGQTPGILTSATVDKVTVTLEPPIAKNQWQYWLQSTPYGQQLQSLLALSAVGGFQVGGVPIFYGVR